MCLVILVKNRSDFLTTQYNWHYRNSGRTNQLTENKCITPRTNVTLQKLKIHKTRTNTQALITLIEKF